MPQIEAQPQRGRRHRTWRTRCAPGFGRPRMIGMRQHRLSMAAMLVLLAILVLLPPIGLLAWSAQALFRSELAVASRRAQNLAEATAIRAEDAVEQTRFLLQEIVKRPAVRALDRAHCDPFLTELRALLPRYANINTFNLDWEFVCTDLPLPPGRIVRSAYPELYRRMLAADGLVLSAPVRGQLTGKLVVIAAYPIKDEDGHLIGAATAPIDLKALGPAIAGTKLPQQALVEVVSSGGILVASIPDNAGAGAPGNLAAAARMRGSSQETEPQEAELVAGADGIERIYARASVRGTDWIAFAALPASRYLADYHDFRDRLVAALFAVAALSTGLAVILARRIARPIRELQQDAAALAEGRLAHRSRVQTQNEIGELASAFNSMAQALEENERARAEAQATMARLAAIVRSSQDAIISMDLEGVIQSWNDGAQRIFGYSEDEILGRSILQLIRLGRHHEEQVILQRVRSGEQIQHFETRRRAKDGTDIDVSIAVSPIKDASGEIVGASKILRDISERRRADEALRGYAERLQRMTRRLMEVEDLERRRIGRELHDRTGSNLSALLLSLEALHSGFPPEMQQALGPQIGACKALLREAMQQVRDVLSDLRPTALDDLGLYAALSHYAGQLTQLGVIEIRAEGCEADPRLPGAVELSLFRIAQEAINNATRHARATLVTVALQPQSDRVTLSIADDGQGFDAAAPRPGSSSLGLETMRERAEAIGAEFAIIAAVGAGTRVVVTVPHRSRRQEPA